MASDLIAEQELQSYFTSCLGIAAQRYDSDHGSSYDPNDAHLRMRDDSHRRAVERHGAVECTLAKLDPVSRSVLALVYEPRASPDLLKIAFRRGFGSFVALAIRSECARAALAKAKPLCDTGPSSVSDWLAWQAGRGDHAPKGLQRAITEECIATHRVALSAYELLRRERVIRERSRARVVEAERERLFNETIGRRSSRPPSSALMRVAAVVVELVELEAVGAGE